ncbi:excalibur calcium-binding domain-containing protein [Streptomyces sp. NBC_01373]|uniref:excalibur calcium-binding domain-containing protein n=1 Tax=Streptomyces sp. NBC_01373 TaxID=2903843 RepID=UPI002256E2E1|nr:excalibur calcium-binding domain-containing protein [Streptomyces sp. NBC_01373]MCX4700923.1 excalibur calcium-binding domain-containing protein [Streptomyces sp. NBC_01373]
MPPTASGPAPKWARKRYVLPALALALFIGVGIGSGDTTTSTDAKPAAAEPQPTVTVTATATAQETAEPEPAATVTATETVKVKVKVDVTRTVTAQPAAGGDDGSSEADTDVYYETCTAVRAAGAAPIRRGEPGHASHLDRDNDGVACDT